MNRKLEIFESVLTSSFNNGSFVGFAREFLNNVELIAPTKYNKEYSNFSFYVDGYYHIGNYISDDNDKIAIFSVCLNRGDTVERARSMQRNFVKPLIEKGGCAGALVAFFTKDEPDKWRLSFIRMDYEFSMGKVKEKLTPAKRYSYLVGKGEPCHTAKQRLYPIFMDDNTNPGIDELEEAFSVEKVTNEFFNLYKEKYIQLKEYLESNEEFMNEAAYRNFTSEQFAKKLMGQIVFLYFIQKKGWLGVEAIPVTMTEKQYKNAFFARGTKSREIVPKVYAQQPDGTYRIVFSELQALSDEDEEFLAGIVKGKPWGSGPKDFMRKIFDGCIDAGKNFFDDYLEPLFYTGLNKNRGENGFYAPLHRRIPFLNGGLFEQLDNYEWENNNFNIPNELFSNKAEKGRDADGILDIFDRYNFTMNEDEPMEREVAIDPEMLGKVFENLLDVTDRKSKGAFYTPREIVHYMCQETLINHLATKTGIPESDIREFILYGDLMKDEDTTKDAREGNKDMLISANIYNPIAGVNRLKELDDILANVKVADLAVGSGAFPLGMLNEIVKARETLSAYMSIGMNAFQKKSFYAYDRKPYDLKVNTIKNCIFACDIEPSAVDIAKLRLWLSIVIDDEITEDVGNGDFDAHSKPRQLPNLDCNIICGNSLIQQFKGVQLITESTLLNNESKDRQQSLFQVGVDSLILRLIELQDKLYFTREHNDKEEIKSEIQHIYDDIILEQIKGNPKLEEEYFELQNETSKPFILWQLYFPKVFRDNGGFDIVIGNPPYVQLQKAIDDTGRKLGDIYDAEKFRSFTKSGDLYCLFFEKGINLLRKGGTLSFITSNKWMKAAYGKAIRKYFVENTNPKILIDFSGVKVFDTATVDVNILLLEKDKNLFDTSACTIKEDAFQNLNYYLSKNFSKTKFVSDSQWVILPEFEKTIKNKIIKVGKPLSEWSISIKFGMKTCFNDAFVIDEDTKNRICNDEPAAIEIMRPLLRGRDIQKYNCEFKNLWMITVHNGIHKYNIPPIDIDMYPVTKGFMNQYFTKLEKRIDQGITPYHLKNCTYFEEFLKPKIVFQEIEQSPSFGLDIEGKYMILDTARMITGERIEYLTALLNSNLFFFAVKHFYGGGALGKTGIRMKHTFFRDFCAYVPTPEEEQMIKEFVLIGGNERDLRINCFFYKKYGLTDEEIKYIEHDLDYIKEK